MLVLKPGVEGPFNQGVWAAVDTDTQEAMKLHGKYASLLSLLLSGYQLRDDFQPLDAFTSESLDKGRAVAKAVIMREESTQ